MESRKFTVDRSRRRALAVAWPLAAGAVLAGIAGMAGAAPAGAERGRVDGPVADHSGPRAGGTDRDRGTAARAGRGTGPDAPGAPSGAQPSGAREDASWDDPNGDCSWKHWEPWEHWHHWPDWQPVMPPISIGNRNADGGLVLVASAGISPPLIGSPPVSGPGAARVPAVGAAAPQAPPPPAPLGGPLPPLPPSPAPAPESTPPPAPAAPASAAAGGVPQPAAVQPNPVRLGYPDYLKSAPLAEIAVLALTGAAGLVGLTGAGGVVGYRQAKAGFALRASGTARFLP